MLTHHSLPTRTRYCVPIVSLVMFYICQPLAVCNLVLYLTVISIRTCLYPGHIITLRFRWRSHSWTNCREIRYAFCYLYMVVMLPIWNEQKKTINNIGNMFFFLGKSWKNIPKCIYTASVVAVRLGFGCFFRNALFPLCEPRKLYINWYNSETS